MHNKNVTITIGISAFLFLFVISLIYILYCYAYYDEAQKEVFVQNYNSKKYDFIFEHLTDKDKLKREDFNKVIDLMYNKNTLENIYNTYYKKNKLYNNSSEFINEYYYGNNKINMDSIEYVQEGKSNLLNRSKFYYKKINLNNGINDSAIGIIDNVTFEIEKDSILKIDNKEISCQDNKCLVDYMFMGLHELNYISNGFTYYGIVNVTSNVRDINITTLDSLVNANLELEVGNNILNFQNLNIGTYKVNECYLERTSCPAKETSYITLDEQGNATFYKYVNYDQAGDLYNGTYEIINGFLVLKFDKHTYELFDYDTKQKSKVEIDADIKIRFKIEDENNIKNEDYSFYLAD